MFQHWDIIATLAFLALYFFLFRKHSYWTSRNVPFRQPDFFYGNTKAMGRTEQVGKFFQRFYTDFKGLHPLVGMYHYLRPIALVTDLELVQRILELDFECFGGRGTYCASHLQLARLYNLSRISRILRISEFQPEVSKHFLSSIRNKVDSRLKNNISKDDLLSMLIQLRNPNESKKGQLSFNELAAQAFGFYLAGVETNSTLLTWTLYELAKRQVLQKKARQHVKTILTKFNGEMSFEAISAMTYLDQIVKESLRKYPPIPVLIRETTKLYQVPGTTTLLEAVTPIYVPVYAIHHDPELYPSPEKFDPERFSPKAKCSPYAWIPFGKGPRSCQGMQLGMMQTKVVLAVLLINIRFAISRKCSLPVEVDVKSFVLTLKDLWLKVESI